MLKSLFPWLLYLLAWIATFYCQFVFNQSFWPTLLFFIILFNGGIETLWLALGDLLFPTSTARSIGWKSCGFQTEAGGANLAIGVTSILCIWYRDWLTPVSLILVIFYSSCAYIHIKERIHNSNKAPLNSGPMLYNTLTVILTVLLSLGMT